jgi:hypothetical protein
MNSQSKRLTARNFQLAALMILLVSVFILGCSKKEATTAAEAPQKTFATPAEAGQALQTAAKAKDNDGIARILGSKGKMLVGSGDPAEDEAAVDSFAKQYERMNRWVAMTDGSRMLYIGASNYPFPIPLAQDASSKWYFNSSAGEEELRARRIGRNELLAMEACRVIANAEDLYRRSAHQYTETIISTPGKQDGLYWEVSEEQPPSPLGKITGFAKGIFASSAPSNTPEFNAYTFRVLVEQGKTGGFTVVASPVHYQKSGIMTFILGRDGILYQQDLGPATANTVASLKEYNPGDGWAQAE